MHIKNIKSKICIGVLSLILTFGAIFGIVKLVDLVSATSAGATGMVAGRTGEVKINYGSAVTSPYTVVEYGDYSNVIATNAMCLQPSQIRVISGIGTIVQNSPNSYSDVVKIMLATDASYGASSNSALGADMAQYAKTHISGLSNYSDGVANFAVGHIIAGAIYHNQGYFGLSSDEQQAANTIKNVILGWYNDTSNAGYTEWQSYYLMTMTPTATNDSTYPDISQYQTVGWLESGGGGVDPGPGPDPTPDTGIVINKYDSDTHEGLAGAGFYVAKQADKDAGNTSAYRYVTTGTNGSYSFTPSESAFWCVQEVTAPSGYTINPSYLNWWNCKLVELNGGDGTVEYNFYDPKDTPTPTTGTIRIYKEDESGNGLTGAIFHLAQEGDTANYQVIDMTSGTMATVSDVEAGTWCLKEVQAPSGYKINPDYAGWDKCYGLGAGGTLSFHVANEKEVTGTLKIKKVDADTNSTTPSGGASISGAVFQVQKCTSSSSCSNYATMTIGSDGTSSLNNLPEGSYKVFEKSAGTGYLVNSSDVRTFNITASSYNIDLTSNPFKNTVIKGGLSITKQRKINAESNGSLSSSTQAFAGVSFDIYRGTTKITTITTNSSGVASTGSSALPYGTYTVKEVSNNVNVAFDKISDQSVTVSSDGVVVNVGTFVDELLDNPTLSTIARESSSTASNPVRQLPITTNASITDRVIYDTLTVGLDYKVCGQVYTVTSKTLLTATPVCTTWTQTSGKTDVDVVFTGIDTTKAIGDSVSIVQRLYVVNNGEDLLLAIHNADLTDADETLTVEGVGITTSAVSLRTGNDKTLTPGIVRIVDTVTAVGLEKDKVYHLRASLVDQNGDVISLSRSDGDNGNRITVDYTMTEESGTVVHPQVNIEFNAANYVGKKVTVYEELYDDNMNLLADHKQLGETSQTLEVVTPTIETVAWRTGAISSSKEIYVSARAGISDVVSMTNLTPGAGYILRGEIYEVSDDGTLVSTTPLVTSDDKMFTVGANTEAATETVEFNLNTASLVGKKLVVYEYLYYGSTKIAEHTEPADANQTVTVATLGISTNAWRSDAIASSKDIYVSRGAQITDVVSMTGLTEGTDYTLRGEIYELTGEGASATIGTNPLASETVRFRASDATGEESAEMTFTVDTTGLIGKELVVFERLYIDDVLVAEHTEKNDSDQIVTVMTLSIATSAWRSDAVGGKKSIYVDKQARVTDVVTMVGLTEGTGYTLQGELYEMITTGAVTTIGDVPVATATKTFTGQGDLDGERVNVDFTLDTTGLAGKRLIVYEKLYIGDTLVASHEDITDPGQIVTVMTPIIDTKAIDATSDGDDDVVDNVIEAANGQVIRDTVSYENLKPGDYYLCGILMDKNTGSVLKINGAEVAEKCAVVTASGETGSFTMDFAVDASGLPGTSIVVFETLYYDNNKSHKIAEHIKIDDGNQTVKVRPMVGTKAVDKYDSDQEVGVGDVAIADTVEYAGIDAGTYTMRGRLIDIDATKESDKETGITAEATFIITDADLVDGLASGEVTMTFSLSTKKYAGHRLVVFEELYLMAEPDMLVAEHKDESDTDQTVTVMVPEIQTMATDGLDEDKTVLPNTKVTIKDRVAYTGLAPGTTYTLKGVLMDKKTGKILVLSDGKEAPEGVLVFEAERDAGVVRMEFAISTAELAGKDIVVFETLYLGEEVEEEVDAETGEVITEGVELGEDDIIAKHEDINDANQTVTVGSPVKVPDTGSEYSNSSDGAKGGYAILIAVFGLVVVGVVGGAKRIFNKRKISFE